MHFPSASTSFSLFHFCSSQTSPSFSLYVLPFFLCLPCFRLPSTTTVMAHLILNRGEVHWLTQAQKLGIPIAWVCICFSSPSLSPFLLMTPFLRLGVPDGWQWEFIYIKCIETGAGGQGKTPVPTVWFCLRWQFSCLAFYSFSIIFI